MPIKKKISIKQKKGKQSQKQSISVNIQIDNRKQKRAKSLQNQYNKLNNLNKQRELLTKNNIQEINKITELNDKINKLENTIAKNSIINEVQTAEMGNNVREEILNEVSKKYNELKRLSKNNEWEDIEETEAYASIPQTNTIPEAEVEIIQVKKRKERSDKGKPRGPYKPESFITIPENKRVNIKFKELKK
jgi:hypothetical protein